MGVTVRRYRRGGWEVDIVWRAPDGRCRRERKRLTVDSRSTARRRGEARERELLVNGPAVRKEVPTFGAFWPRFLDGYARANRQKPSGIAAKETIGRVHLQPHFGTKRLDAITTEQVQRLKHALTNRAPKTVNNVLTVLNVVLRKAVEWNVLERMPCVIRLMRIRTPSEVPSREGAAGAGLQVLLEANGVGGICELDGGAQSPGTMLQGMHRLSGIVFMQPAGYVGGDANVVSIRIGDALEDVDETAGFHGR